MNLDDQILFFLSALGAFNCLLLSLYFFFVAKPKHVSNYFLGGLLTVLSIRVWKSIFFYFNPELSKTYLQIGLSACFFIGPFLYFYIKAKQSQEIKKHWLYQLSFLALITLVVGILYPYEQNSQLWGYYFYKIINYQWILMIVISGFSISDTFKKVISKEEQLDYDDFWMLSVFSGILLIWIAYFTASYTSYITGALSFSFTLYLSISVLVYQRKKSFTTTAKKEKYASNKISSDEAKSLFEKIEKTINDQKLFKNPNLTLPQLAKTVNIRQHRISQLLNDNLDKSFTQFVNEYRIEEAKKLLKTDSNLKMEIIAEKSGFNSNSTFYTAFKKITNTTPAKYLNH